MKKSSSVAGRTRRRVGNTRRPAAEHDFVICPNARVDMYLCYQAGF